jgi:hypothetical protein
MTDELRHRIVAIYAAAAAMKCPHGAPVAHPCSACKQAAEYWRSCDER